MIFFLYSLCLYCVLSRIQTNTVLCQCSVQFGHTYSNEMCESDQHTDKTVENAEKGPTQKQHPVYQFIDCDRNKYVCKVCDHVFSNSHTGNMRKHIERNHARENTLLQKSLESYYSDDKTKKKKRHCNRVGRIHSNLITVEHYVGDIKQGFVEMCSVNMWSFAQLRHSGLSRIVAPIIEESRRFGIPLSNQPEAIEAYSLFEQKKIMDTIKNELAGKLFSVMMDATTTQNRCILGIAAQYMVDDQIVVRTLAMRRVKDDHSGVSLSKILKTVLYEYGTNPAMVYTITTDNEPSAVKCVRDTEVNMKYF